ncbi:3-hydroxylacyl-ACP dehydratase [Crenobacter sp. SG2303]|uniref:3-hydroxylacyl-ACP dehydratase n=1 Tax=Crenobacter oryzisoli TaxID=3056844 RepID=A0ABT7XKQ9_9NEIS|nr:3-hydroxylacyl-ACP dehydratase [Crenobacter sp. SG2303]MDN0074382.1 3-hydroxylacyl-ACP dehydratase [Crenobacter sp. SG2303]
MRVIDKAEIARLIPHQGTMCLIERASHWDADSIVCHADSHRLADNPLRQQGRLGAACAIEYAAQAMALHGALTAGFDTAPRAGFLTSVRDVTLAVATLDDVDTELLIEVERLMGDENNVMYRFTVNAAQRLLASGRAAVRLDAARHLNEKGNKE